jgi:hypothetical protein
VARRIDADADELDSAPLELLVVPSKADQLPVAVRSPVAPVEDELQGTLGVPAAQLEGLLRSSGSTKVGNSPPTLMFTMDGPFR